MAAAACGDCGSWSDSSVSCPLCPDFVAPVFPLQPTKRNRTGRRARRLRRRTPLPPPRRTLAARGAGGGACKSWRRAALLATGRRRTGADKMAPRTGMSRRACWCDARSVQRWAMRVSVRREIPRMRAASRGCPDGREHAQDVQALDPERRSGSPQRPCRGRRRTPMARVGVRGRSSIAALVRREHDRALGAFSSSRTLPASRRRDAAIAAGSMLIGLRAWRVPSACERVRPARAGRRCAQRGQVQRDDVRSDSTGPRGTPPSRARLCRACRGDEAYVDSLIAAWRRSARSRVPGRAAGGCNPREMSPTPSRNSVPPSVSREQPGRAPRRR